MVPDREALRRHLEKRQRPPVPRALLLAVERAVELCVANLDDQLVEVHSGPSLAAGTIVEMLALDWAVDPCD